jgi:hypothetical protein
MNYGGQARLAGNWLDSSRLSCSWLACYSGTQTTKNDRLRHYATRGVSFPPVGLFQAGDVELLHLKHRLHDSFHSCRIFVLHHLD